MNLFFRKYGSGPAMIIVHGLYGASDNWIQVGKILGKYFEVFLVDQRNHGRSPHHPVHTYQAMKEDLLEFMNQQEISSAILLGHSMGGKTVMSFAADHPGRTNGMVVVDIAPKSYRMSKGHPAHQTIIKAMSRVNFKDIRTRAGVDEALSRDIPSIRIRQFLMKNLHRDKNQAFSWSLNLEALQKNLDEILEGMDEKSFDQGKQVTGFPALFLRGANSPYIQDTDVEMIHRIFPLAEVITIPDAGHWLHVEQPTLLTRTILSFFLE